MWIGTHHRVVDMWECGPRPSKARPDWIQPPSGHPNESVEESSLPTPFILKTLLVLYSSDGSCDRRQSCFPHLRSPHQLHEGPHTLLFQGMNRSFDVLGPLRWLPILFHNLLWCYRKAETYGRLREIQYLFDSRHCCCYYFRTLIFQENYFRKIIDVTMVRDRQHGPIIELNRVSWCGLNAS